MKAVKPKMKRMLIKVPAGNEELYECKKLVRFIAYHVDELEEEIFSEMYSLK